jgi:hypothetical protein
MRLAFYDSVNHYYSSPVGSLYGFGTLQTVIWELDSHELAFCLLVHATPKVYVLREAWNFDP